MPSSQKTPPPPLLRRLNRKFGKPDVAGWGREFVQSYEQKQHKGGGGEPLKIELRVGGVDEVAADLASFSNRAGDRIRTTTHHYGMRLRSEVRRFASSVIDASDYIDNIVLRTGRGALAVVETEEEQANRLEYGFVGVDSLGRQVEQRPRPHFRPALARVRGDYIRAVHEALYR